MQFHLPRLELATLLVVDVQERLLPAMYSEDQPPLLKAITNLCHAFRDFGGTTVFSEQYPKGLGPTVPALVEPLDGALRVEKVEFSVMKTKNAFELPMSPDIVLTGIEAHVCVLLTGLDLLAAGHRVWVPIDGVASRRRENRDNGLSLLARAGATLVNSESLIFAALERAGGDRFKRFSMLIR